MKKPKKMVIIYKEVDIIWSALCDGSWVVLLNRHPRFKTIKEAKDYIDLNSNQLKKIL